MDTEQIAIKDGATARLLSRNRTNFSGDYPQLIDSLEGLKAKNAIIESVKIVALDDGGKPSFQLLQSYGIRKQIQLARSLAKTIDGQDPQNKETGQGFSS